MGYRRGRGVGEGKGVVEVRVRGGLLGEGRSCYCWTLEAEGTLD